MRDQIIQIAQHGNELSTAILVIVYEVVRGIREPCYGCMVSGSTASVSVELKRISRRLPTDVPHYPTVLRTSSHGIPQHPMVFHGIRSTSSLALLVHVLEYSTSSPLPSPLDLRV